MNRKQSFKKRFKRAIASVLTLCMLLSMLPAVMAALPMVYEYRQETTGTVESGAVYAIYTNEETDSNNRILYHTGNGTTDKVGGAVSENKLTLNSGFASSRQLWTITKNSNDSTYTVQSVDSGRYLDLSTASSKNIQTSADPVWLTLTWQAETQTYTISQNGGTSLSYVVGNIFAGDTPYGVRLFKQTEVVPELAPGASAGTSMGQPFVKGDTGSDYFRIPSLITLDNGWIVASSDIRWRTSGDSPQNLDTIVSISKDGGNTWDWEVVNYFGDMADTATGQSSASFIDPSVLQAEDGTIHMVVDACPSYVGLMWGNKMGRESSGFDAQGRLLVAKGTAGEAAPTTKSSYTYYVDINHASAGQTMQVNGEDVVLYPICETVDNKQTGVWVDPWLNVYTTGTYTIQNDTEVYQVGEDTVSPDYCPQLDSNQVVQSNLFFLNSEWKAYPVFYIMHRSATVGTDGLVWSDPQFLDIKLNEDEAFTGVCPGRGLSFQYNGQERLIFPLYDNQTGNELASVIYSDDGGISWHRGQRNADLNGVGKTSESQVVALPNGTLRMYSRNTIDYISYADSTDGGETWGTCQKDMDLYSKNPGNGCMVSFINLDGVLVAPDNTIYENLILASYPVVQRSQGVVRIGSIGKDGTVTWLNGDETRYQGAGNFSYSCVTQLLGENNTPSDVFGILYEYGNETETIHYEQVTVKDLLGDGWFLVHDTSVTPKITIHSLFLDMEIGEQVTLQAVVEPAGTPVVWESSNPTVATVNNGSVTAITSGTTTITATISTNGITRSASVPVAVQGAEGSQVILPDLFVDAIEAVHYDAKTTYDLATNGIESGEAYAIFHRGSSRILYHASGASTTDHVTGSVEGNSLTLDGGYAESRQLWTITQQENGGYTVQSKEADGRYLNLNKVTTPGSKVPVTDEQQTLTITASGAEGAYTIGRVVDGQSLYLAHEDGSTQHYVSATPVEFALFRQNIVLEHTAYCTSVAGLERFVGYIKSLDTSYQNELEDELNAAYTVIENGTVEYATEQEAMEHQQSIDEATRALYQAWQALNLQEVWYTVTFESNGGTPVVSQTVAENQVAVKPADPTRSGYIFGGWYQDSACTIAYDFATPVTGNLTLYAKWTEETVVVYTVTFESNGGTAVTSQTVAENQVAVKPADPTRSGYIFGGWYQDSACTIAYDFATPVTGNLTLYAKWTEETVVVYTVTFESNGGTAVTSQTVAENQVAVKPADPTRSGYIFGGWYQDSACTIAYDFATPVTGNLTLYAKWNSQGGGSGGGGGSYTPPSNTEKHPDGSTTTTVTKPDGTKVETTKYPDGSQTVVETKKDGTIITTTTDKTGNQMEIEAKTDGTSQIIMTQTDGSRSTTTVDQNGHVASQVTVSKELVSSAQGKAIQLPVPALPVTTNQTIAPTVSVNLPSNGSARVEIPVTNVTYGVVAILQKADGTTEVLKTSTITENGLSVTVQHGDTIQIVDKTKKFDDVAASHWGVDAITFVTSRELFSGTGETTFAPDVAMNRAMIVTVLSQLDGVDASSGENWYDAGRQWAMEKGISDGSNMEQNLTREQLATMLWRYAGSPTPSADTSAYADHDNISTYAQQAMSWAVEQGILSGTSTNTLSPQGYATRAQVATMLMRFIESIA